MTETDDPKRVLAEVLKDEWDTTNTLGVDPDIRTGWRDSDLPGPQVTVGPDEESPTSPTGFTGMKGDGSGPTATTRGTVQINTWTTHDQTAENGKHLADRFKAEIKAVVRNNIYISNHNFAIADLTAENYRYISYLGAEFMPDEPDDDEDPIVFRYRVVVRYEYLDEP